MGAICPELATIMKLADAARLGALLEAAERIELLKRHREEVRRALASQRECLKLLDTKIGHYASCLAEAASQTTEL